LPNYLHEPYHGSTTEVKNPQKTKLWHLISFALYSLIPYLLVVGEKEIAENAVSVRKRKEGDLGKKSLEEFLKNITLS